jgi:hypothetical protein
MAGRETIWRNAVILVSYPPKSADRLAQTSLLLTGSLSSSLQLRMWSVSLTAEDDFLACIDDSATAEYARWDLDRIRDHRGRRAFEAKRSPFELREVYPWWDTLPRA